MRLVSWVPSGLAGVLVTLFLAGSGVAQDSKGQILGTVLDIEGQPLPGVTLSVSSSALLRSRSAESGQNGQFLVASLAPGTYLVEEIGRAHV